MNHGERMLQKQEKNKGQFYCDIFNKTIARTVSDVECGRKGLTLGL